MKIVITPRGHGKTTQLIKLSAANNGYIVCSDIDTAAYIASIASDMGLNINHPITYKEFINGEYGRVESFLIDNVENLVSHISMAPISAISISAKGVSQTVDND